MAAYVVLGTGSAAAVAVGRCASRHARPSEVDAAPAVRHVAVAVPAAGPEVPGRRCPMDALAYGVAFSVTACAGCAPVLIGLGSAIALVGGPGTALTVLVFFLAGRTAVLLAAAAFGARLLARPGGVRVFDVLVGVSLLAAAAYYVYLVATGRVSSVLPGEPGATLLP